MKYWSQKASILKLESNELLGQKLWQPRKTKIDDANWDILHPCTGTEGVLSRWRIFLSYGIHIQREEVTGMRHGVTRQGRHGDEDKLDQYMVGIVSAPCQASSGQHGAKYHIRRYKTYMLIVTGSQANKIWAWLNQKGGMQQGSTSRSAGLDHTFAWTLGISMAWGVII